MVGETATDLVQKAVQVKGVRIVRHVQSEDMKHLVNMAKELLGHPKTVVVLGSDLQGAKIVVARSPDVARWTAGRSSPRRSRSSVAPAAGSRTSPRAGGRTPPSLRRPWTG